MKKVLRKGFTTGSCAAAASRAAAVMLFSGKQIDIIEIETPCGEIFRTKINYVNLIEGCSASCAVLKDGGDDPDVTTGLYIFSEVSYASDDIMSTKSDEKNNNEIMSTDEGSSPDSVMLTNIPSGSSDGISIEIDGGEGIGRVTKPGLDRKAGEAAINSVPRRMIDEAVRMEAVKSGFRGKLRIMISAPGGEERAKKTFNPRLGIQGGISILGTSGIENPMSEQALIDTIEVEMKMHKAAGEKVIAVTPGNYGQEYMLRAFGYDIDRSVRCSNFIGPAIDLASSLGFRAMLLTGHIGKLVKLSGGITNTHSSNGDCRMELLSAAALRAGCGNETCRAVLDCISTEEALRYIKEEKKLEKTMDILMDRVMDTLRRRAGEELTVECIMYSNDFGALAESRGARELLYSCDPATCQSAE